MVSFYGTAVKKGIELLTLSVVPVSFIPSISTFGALHSELGALSMGAKLGIGIRS